MCSLLAGHALSALRCAGGPGTEGEKEGKERERGGERGTEGRGNNEEETGELQDEVTQEARNGDRAERRNGDRAERRKDNEQGKVKRRMVVGLGWIQSRT